MPSSTNTVWVRSGGSESLRPAIAAIPTAIIDPEIRPPGRPAARNAKPPAAPMTSVSAVLKSLARLGHSNGREAVICFTPPYRKSARGAQLQLGHTAMRAPPAEGREGLRRIYFLSAATGPAMPPLAVLMQSERNFLRSLPWSPSPSACLEQSSETAQFCFGTF